MPKRRQPREIWERTRARIWTRDGGICQSPLPAAICRGKDGVPLSEAHVDHIRSGKLGSNHARNLRLTCRVCHVLRADFRHRGMLASALRDGILPEDWRAHLWD